MKPYGREENLKCGKRPWKTDYHPQKGFKNWWEDMVQYLSRSRMKQKYKKEINKEINDGKA